MAFSKLPFSTCQVVVCRQHHHHHHEEFSGTDVAADKTLRNNRSIFFYDIILLI
jgi:hypothetical protein